ncbi:tubulin-like doman-containing protein [Pseudoneobacillus sp. C159]
MNVPTILIGLGGIGSQIVNKIYGDIPLESRKRVAIHVFDTDMNSIKKLKHLKDHATQTSTNKSVGEYLHQNESALAWFPQNPQLKKKTMTEGAGQIRAVSRLAFQAAMADRKLNSLWESIENIFPVQRDEFTSGIRVIIVSSLVGGTGSGIFLQVAMNLREMLERKFGHSSVLIRGAFLLPDILVRSNTLDIREWESVQANGYASLKELNAITLAASGQLKNNQDVTIELEYRPHQIDLAGRTTHAITDKQLPYDFCFLYDYENLKGEHLNSVSDYIDQVSRTIYLQLFSPLSTQHFSQEDNQILELINSEGRGRYCGAGAASLSYPYEDIVYYNALKWSVSGLDDSWLILDKIYEEERRKYELDLRKGINREKLDRGERFTFNFDQLLNDEQPNPFFKQINLQIRQELDKGKRGELKSELFVKAVEEKVIQVLKSDPELESFSYNHCQVDDGKLAIKDQIKKEINRVEGALKFYWDQINKKVYEYQTFITHQVIDPDYEKESSGIQDYRLNTWFLQKPEPVHPIAVRYLLYKVHRSLNEQLKFYRDENHRLKIQIEKYDKAYHIGDSDMTIDAGKRVEHALNQSFFGKWIRKNDLRDFIKEYKQKSGRQLATLNRYKETMLLQNVFTAINTAIQGMIKDWERFFENLVETRNSLEAELTQRAVMYEETNDPTKEYILATKELQDKVWEQIRGDISNDLLPVSICKEIYLSHYRQFIDRQNATYQHGLYDEIKVEEFYRKYVLNYCVEELKIRKNDQLDLDVIQAIRKEARFLNIQPEKYLEERLSVLENLSSPYIPLIQHHRELKFWGIHTDGLKKLSETMKQELFKSKEVADPAFSKYEVICYRAHYGLLVENFSKFSDGETSENHQRSPGVYYEAYRKRIDKLNRGEATVTPHLDKRWHVPAFMPDLNKSQAKLENKKADQAFLIGIIYEWLQLVSDEGRKNYHYYGVQGDRLVMKSGMAISEEIYSLHQAMPHNPVIYEEILDRFIDQREKDRKNEPDIMKHRFINGCQVVQKISKDKMNNILDVVFLYEEEDLGNADLLEDGDKVRLCLLDEIGQYFETIFGPHRTIKAREEAANFIYGLWMGSAMRMSSNPDSVQYKKWENLIKNRVEILKEAQKVRS